MMQRRNFLRGLLGIAATAAAAPLIKLLPAPAAPAATYTSYLIGEDAVFSANIGQYADYVSFSDLLMDTTDNGLIDIAAKELSYRAAFTLNQLNASPEFHAQLRRAGYRVDQRELARLNREVRRERYVAKQRRRSARMIAQCRDEVKFFAHRAAA